MRALGWKEVEVIGSDLGSSAAIASARREGFERVLSSVALGDVGMACETLYVCKHAQGEKCVRLMHLLLDRLRGAFHLRSGSCCGHDFADSPSDQLGTVKMDPVSAVARYQLSPTRRELRQVAFPHQGLSLINTR
jgi:hypothetical protein